MGFGEEGALLETDLGMGREEDAGEGIQGAQHERRRLRKPGEKQLGSSLGEVSSRAWVSEAWRRRRWGEHRQEAWLWLQQRRGGGS